MARHDGPPYSPCPGGWATLSPQHQRRDRGPAGRAALVRPDLKPQVGDAIGRDRPVLPLEGRARRAEVVLLAEHFPVGPPAVGGDSKLEFLRAGDLQLLDRQGDTTD